MVVLTAYHAIVCKWLALETAWGAKETTSFILCHPLKTLHLKWLAAHPLQELRVRHSSHQGEGVRVWGSHQLENNHAGGSVLFSFQRWQLQSLFHSFPHHLSLATKGWGSWYSWGWAVKWFQQSRHVAKKLLPMHVSILFVNERKNEWVSLSTWPMFADWLLAQC